MHTFTDTKGRTWRIEINIGVIRAIKEAMQIDLLDIGDGQTLARLADDPITLCDLLWLLVSDQAATAGGANGIVTDIDFARGLAGDVIASATTALLQELVDFFPNPRRQVLARVLEKMEALQGVMAQTLLQKLDDPRIEEDMRQLLNSGMPSGKTPASSDSPRKD